MCGLSSSHLSFVIWNQQRDILIGGFQLLFIFLICVSEHNVSLSCTVKKSPKEYVVQLKGWFLDASKICLGWWKALQKLEEQGRGTEDEEGCRIPIYFDQFSNGLASSDVVVATKLFSFSHRSGQYLPQVVFAAGELVDRLLATAASWKVLQLIQNGSSRG